jgi:hypothetical protein
MLNKRFKLHLTKSTVEKFRSKRWSVQKENLERQKNQYAAQAALISHGGLNAAAQALLFEQVRELNPAHLLGIMRLQQERDKLKLQKKALAASVEDPTKEITPQHRLEVTQKALVAMKQIFGISTPTGIYPPWPNGPSLIDEDNMNHNLYVADIHPPHTLNHEALARAWEQLCTPEGWHGHTYQGPRKAAAISRLRELYGIVGLPWPGGDTPQPQPVESIKAEENASP